MTLLISSILLSLIGLAISLYVSRKTPQLSARVTAGLILMLLLIPLTLVAPKLSITTSWLAAAEPTLTSSLQEGAAGANHGQHSTPTSHWSTWGQTYLIAAWTLGFLFCMGKLIVNYLALRSLIKGAKSADESIYTTFDRCTESIHHTSEASTPMLLVSSQLDSPIVTGIIKPIILLPASSTEWSENTIKNALLHELAHIQRKDLFISLLSQLVCAMHWFNPLVWILANKHREQCEYACDSHVISMGADEKQYIYALCDVAEQASRVRFSSALAMANESSLKTRVHHLLEGKEAKHTWIPLTVISLLAVCGISANIVQPSAPEQDLTQKYSTAPHTGLKDPVPEDKHAVATPGDAKPSPEEIELRLSADPFPDN